MQFFCLCAPVTVIDIVNTEIIGSGSDGPWVDGDHVLRTCYGIMQMHDENGPFELVSFIHPDGTVRHYMQTCRTTYVH